MATSRASNNRRYNNTSNYHQPSFQRPNQAPGIMPFNMTPTQSRAPLIQQNPPMGIPPQFSAPRGVVPAPQMIFPPNPQMMPGRPHFHPPQQQYPTQGAFYPHHMMPQNPAPQIISNPSMGAPKGGNIMNFTPQNPPTVYQSQHQVKKRSNAIAIINPDTKEEVKASEEKNSLKAGGSSTSVSSNTSVSSTTPANEVAVEFKSKIQSSLQPKPNAIISTPSTSGSETTVQSVQITEGAREGPVSQQKVPEPPVVEKSINSNTELSSSSVTKNTKPESTTKASTDTTTVVKPVEIKPPQEIKEEVITVTEDSVAVDVPESKTVTEVTDSKEEPDQPVPIKEPDVKETDIKEESKVMPPEVNEEVTNTTIPAVAEVVVAPPKPSVPVTKEKKGKIEKEPTRLPALKGHQKETKKEPEKTISVQVKQEELTKVPEKKSLLGEPTGHMIVTSPPTIDYDLEEGEIHPSEDTGIIVNGNCEEIDFGGHVELDDHDQRKYDRNFLLEYRRLATDPPEQLRGMTDVFCPHGADMTTVPVNYHRKPSKPHPKKVIDHKPQAFEKVELHKAEKRWVRAMDQEMPEEARKTQDLFRKFQGILNKLTPQKFSDLASKAQLLEIDTEEKLHGCIDRIFEKALEEPNFSIAYANLCRVLSNIKVNVIRSNEEGEEIVKETSFRRELLTKCQKEFEKDKKDDDNRELQLKAIEAATSEEERKKKQEEYDEWETVARKRSLGNIRFIGELFKLKMLSEGIMHDCILRLLRSTSDQESLECFCRLITTTGKDLDHPQAKQRLDRYFERIFEIIEKKKISSRIKFMLQDVQDLRKSNWIPRRQEGLKTIDQIHHEAKIEAEAEQEMIKQMAAVGNVKTYPRDDKKRGSKTQDDFPSTSSRTRSHEKRSSAADVNKILAIRKKDGGQGVTLGGGGLRPSSSGWGANRKKDGQTPPPSEKERPSSSKSLPQKSSGAGNKKQQQPAGQTGSGRGSLPGSRRSSSQPTERQSVFNALNKVMNQTLTGTALPATTSAAVSVAKKPALDEDTIRRKTSTIVDEFAENKDYNEAIACVNELDSSSLLNIFVSEAILHTLEKSSNSREYAGRLLDCLYTKNVVSKETLHSGLQEVIGMVEDLEVDIPKVWDFLAEILSPLFLCECFVLTEYYDLISEAEIGFKAPRALARLLQHCVGKSSKGTVSDIWTKSKLKWTSIGLDDGEEDEFLEDEKLQFLSSSSISDTPPIVTTPSYIIENPPYFKDLVVMFGRTDVSNDEIFEWIQSQKIKVDVLFIRNLSRASIDASTSGEGDCCILSDENFRKRLAVVKRYVDQNEEFQLQVLNAMQCSMDILKHPPSMLSTVFWSLYDVEVVSEVVCYEWRDKSRESIGRGMALQTSKNFFDWIDSADQESDNS